MLIWPVFSLLRRLGKDYSLTPEYYIGSKFWSGSFSCYIQCVPHWLAICSGIYRGCRKVCSHSLSKIRHFRAWYPYRHKELVSKNPLSWTKLCLAEIKLSLSLLKIFFQSPPATITKIPSPMSANVFLLHWNSSLICRHALEISSKLEMYGTDS